MAQMDEEKKSLLDWRDVGTTLELFVEKFSSRPAQRRP
jgi:hypothetical protein